MVVSLLRKGKFLCFTKSRGVAGSRMSEFSKCKGDALGSSKPLDGGQRLILAHLGKEIFSELHTSKGGSRLKGDGKDRTDLSVLRVGTMCVDDQNDKPNTASVEVSFKDIVDLRGSYASLLRLYSSAKSLSDGRRVHFDIIKSGHQRERFLGNLLVEMYGKCGALEDARAVFDSLSSRNVFSWTIMIGAYAQHGQGKEALQLFQQMQLEGVRPNRVTFVNILSACASQEFLAEGRRMHTRIVANAFESDAVVGNALVNMYRRCGSPEDARRMFDKMPERDVVTWNAMIATYVQHRQGKKALQLFQQMQLEGVTPNTVTFVSILDACASHAALAEGKRMHARIVSIGFESDVFVGTALVNLYGKCGSLEDARRMFDRMPERNVVSWNAMIAAYAQHGQGKEALQLFQQMQLENVIPNKITFVSILSACSHTGLLNEGCYCFASMDADHGITPTEEHYNCMIDLLGRAGRLDEGEDLVCNMPLQPTVMSWTALLGTCRMRLEVARGKRIAGHLFELNTDIDTPYVLLSKIYAATGKWDDAANVRKLMEDKGVKKEAGHSSIEVKNMVHEFLVGDESHPSKKEIYAELHRLSKQMEEVGYVPDMKVVLCNVEEEEKKYMLRHHSEKLAIAFGLFSTPPGTPLRVIKNLRVCVDCHSASKFISMIAHREVILRDANRFHYFKNGACSCADYW